MTALPPLDVSEFAAFFAAIHGHEPFPWQVRLARTVAEGGWPRLLDLPTGSGKTAALDVAVFLLALQADAVPRPSARRIVFVVDRRTIVDQAFERAKAIRCALTHSAHDVVGRVRRRLASLSMDGRPLDVALLRGGIVRDDGWARTPDQPLIAVSTVDQVGSRLLFRGYGVSDGMKPVHAGLLGHDVLYLLDEVHLSQPFRETLTAIAGRYRSWASRLLPGPFAVVEMSATAGAVGGPPAFELDDDDRANPVLARRLQARKPVVIALAKAAAFQSEIGKHALGMLDRPGVTVAVVVNRVNSARELHRHLRGAVEARGGEAHLLTGRMRPFDRDQMEQGILARIRAGRKRSSEDRPVIVVATQSIEAGADFDFDGLVTECASIDALRQRFGRLDRLGEMGNSARGVIVARADSLKDDPVYGGAIGQTWAWLQRLDANGGVDFGIESLPVPGTAEADGLISPKPHAPVLLPSHLDAWIQTAPMPEPDPDVALWLHGPQRDSADVQVVWRADLDEDLLRRAGSDAEPGAAAAADAAIGVVELLRPGSAETLAVPFVAARRWLMGQEEPETADVEGGTGDEDADWQRGELVRPAVLWRGDESRVILPADLRPGHTIVVPASYGGIANANWAPASTQPVLDVAELAVARHRREFVIRLHPRVVRDIAGSDTNAPPPPGPVEPDGPDDREVVLEWLADLANSTPSTPLHDLARTVPQFTRSVRVERVAAGAVEGGFAEYFVARWPLPLKEHSDADASGAAETEDGSSTSFSFADVALTEHANGVAATVVALAERVGIPNDLVGDLAQAAEWHDAGKADPRFQRWLHGGSEFKAMAAPALLAKSRVNLGPAARRVARERAGYPAGTRHELMSVALMGAAAASITKSAHDQALVWHLVASHHGYCRPLAPWIPDAAPVDVLYECAGVACRVSSAHDLARLDSGVAERFWQVVRTYGWWGSAWLEAVFRLADHRQSEREQTEGRRG